MESFEKNWADRHDVPVETLAQYRHADGSGYRLPGIAKNYRTWCDAIGSVEIELPAADSEFEYPHAGTTYFDGPEYRCAAIKAIEELGVKCK
jgi:hypothetical protein